MKRIAFHDSTNYINSSSDKSFLENTLYSNFNLKNGMRRLIDIAILIKWPTNQEYVPMIFKIYRDFGKKEILIMPVKLLTSLIRSRPAHGVGGGRVLWSITGPVSLRKAGRGTWTPFSRWDGLILSNGCYDYRWSTDFLITRSRQCSE